MSSNTTTYRRPSVSIGQGLDGADYSYLTKPNKDGTGFFVQFTIPFKKQDVFNELLNDNGSIGCDGNTGTQIRILKAGREENKLISSGCVRETIYTAPVWGRTITELREIKAPNYIRWSTLMQEGTFFQFVGKGDDNAKIQIALKELKKGAGTQITMRLDFLEVGFNGVLCCLSFIAQDLLKMMMETNLPKMWTESMITRGYDRVDTKKKAKKKKGGN